MSCVKKKGWLKTACYIMFAVYILFLLKIVLFKYTGVFALIEKIIDGKLDGFRSVNVIPFSTFREFGTMLVTGQFSRGFMNLAGNIFVFAPLGYFLPLLFEKCRRSKGVILSGFITSCLFELCQYIFYLGSADIDDVILNVLGVILGMAFYCMMKNLTKGKVCTLYRITLFLSMIGFIVAAIAAVNYFGLMFGVDNSGSNNADYGKKFEENIEENFDNVQIEMNTENEFEILGKIVSIEGDILTIDQVQELDENTALSSNDNRNLKTIHLLPATKYIQMDVYDSEGKKTGTKNAQKEDLETEKFINIKGYRDGEDFFSTEIVINNYLF